MFDKICGLGCSFVSLVFQDARELVGLYHVPTSTPMLFSIDVCFGSDGLYSVKGNTLGPSEATCMPTGDKCSCQTPRGSMYQTPYSHAEVDMLVTMQPTYVEE